LQLEVEEIASGFFGMVDQHIIAEPLDPRASSGSKAMGAGLRHGESLQQSRLNPTQ
jgi:hypothetical protein